MSGTPDQACRSCGNTAGLVEHARRSAKTPPKDNIFRIDVRIPEPSFDLRALFGHGAVEAIAVPTFDLPRLRRLRAIANARPVALRATHEDKT
jgi:hypothetical protein